MLVSRKPCKTEQFWQNFWPTGCFCRGAIPVFKKNFVSPKMAAILNFRIFCKTQKMLISQKLCEIEQFRCNFWPRGYPCRVAIWILQKFFVSWNGGHFEFSNFFIKIAKHKNAYMLKIMLDRAISTKFLIHRVSLWSSHNIFLKICMLPKVTAILNFRIFHKNCKTQKYLYLEYHARLIRVVSLQSSNPDFIIYAIIVIAQYLINYADFGSHISIRL